MNEQTNPNTTPDPSTKPKPVVHHYSDILCVWAYVSNIRFEKLMQKYAHQVNFEQHFCSVFPDTAGKIDAAWGKRGGFGAYGDHVQAVAGEFDHVEVSPDVWGVARPVSSTAPHMVLKAAELEDRAADPEGRVALIERAAYRLSWALRQAFFQHGRDIAIWEVQSDCARAVGLDPDALQGHLQSGAAAAELDRDIVAAQKAAITGSPTFYMNGGRQVLYGNVGYKLLEANVEELLRARGPDEASWC